MEILKDVKIVDLALYLTKHKTLVFADFHIGFEESLNKQGILIPRFQFKKIIQRLEKIFNQIKDIETIVVNGDLKHEFGTVSNQEWRETLKLLDFLKRYCKKLILVKGNHDTILEPIADKKNMEIVDSYNLDNISILHGHKIQPTKAEIIIIGHEHPALGVKEGARVEKFKAFLKGEINSQTLIVQPSFNLVTEGTDVLNEKKLSPYLQDDLSNFEVFVIADKIYGFGKIKDLE